MVEQRMDLNSASVEELMQLPGIGPALAERIVRHRSTVRPFGEPVQITAVPRIGESTYSAIADRVTVAAADESPQSAVSASEGDLEEEATVPQAWEPREETNREGEAGGPEWPAGNEGQGFEQPAAEGHRPEDMTKLQEEVGESPPEAGETRAEEKAEVGEVPAEEPPHVERGLRPTPQAARAELTQAASFWSQLSWLWTAILGGFLGMIFTLVVFAGVNGALDVAHSRAVLDLEGRMKGLVADFDTLQGDVHGMRRRLDALEGLTARMDRVESAVDNLQEETAELNRRTNALEEDLTAVREELQAVSHDVATLQEQAERTESFFFRLRAMLDDLFAEVDEDPGPTPTPEDKGG